MPAKAVQSCQGLLVLIACCAPLGCFAGHQELPGQLPALPAPNEEGLLLYLHPERPRYEVDTPTYVAVELHNEGETNHLLCVAFSPSLYVLQFQIKDPAGEILGGPNLVLQHQLHPSDFVRLPPLVYVGDHIDLSLFYSLHRRGRYRVKAIYDSQDLAAKAPESTWIGMLESNEVEIVVD